MDDRCLVTLVLIVPAGLIFRLANRFQHVTANPFRKTCRQLLRGCSQGPRADERLIEKIFIVRSRGFGFVPDGFLVVI